MPLSPHFSPRASGFEEDGEAEGAGSVRSKIVQGLALVKRNLAGAFGEAQRGREASAGAGEAGLQPPPPSPADLGSPARKVPAGSGPPRGGVVGCAFDIMGKKEVQALAGNHAAIAPAPPSSALAPASPPACLPRTEISPRQADWADGLPPDFLEDLARLLSDACEPGEWATVQDVYSASAVCRSWRQAVHRSCFLRSPASLEPARPRTVRRTCSDRMICHPSQLLERLATSEDIIRCYIRRDRTRGPFPHRRYDLYLGEDHSKEGKHLLVAHHHLLATRSSYGIYLAGSGKGASLPTQHERLGQLQSTPYGTAFELHQAQGLGPREGRVRRTKSGSVKYSFNMLGGRGPRSVRVRLEDQAEDEGGEEGTVLENKLPRWHELLQCWCLDFGGRVKCASVKNFQLVSRDDQEEIILQFGKVEPDVFTMDFRPKVLSAQQAFMICLSSFDSKLSCF